MVERGVAVKKALVLLVLVLIVGVVLFVIFDRANFSQNGQDVQFVTDILVIRGGESKEIRIMNPSRHSYLFENGVKMRVVSVIPTTSVGILQLPKIGTVLGKNVPDSRLPVSELTWVSSLYESSGYIQFLLDSGYVIDLIAYTSQFIECFLTRDGVTKRVIIFNEFIMVGDLLEGVALPSVDSYFKKHIK